MINRIHVIIDRRSLLIHRFDSFLRNGVRASLIVLISFFKNWQMDVKWKVILSKMCHLPGRGPQGGTLGIEEYPSQNNDNVEFQPDDKKNQVY